MKKKLTLRYSSVSLLNYCPMAWYLTYVQGYQPSVTSRPFRKGSAFHKGVEACLQYLWVNDLTKQSADEIRRELEVGGYIQSDALITGEFSAAVVEGRKAGVMSAELEEEMREECSVAKWMVRHYMHHFAETLAYKFVLGVEIEFDFDATANVTLHGTIDLILYDPFANVILLVDHKSAADLLSAEKRLIDSVQLLGYQAWIKDEIWSGSDFGLNSMIGKDLDLSEASVRPMYALVRSKAPREPKILQKGGVSSAAVSTIKSVYQEALDRVGTEPTEKQINRLNSLPESWYTTVEPFFDPNDEDDLKDILHVAAERMSNAIELPMYRTKNTSNCHECRLRTLCKTGSDPNYKKETV